MSESYKWDCPLCHNMPREESQIRHVADHLRHLADDEIGPRPWVLSLRRHQAEELLLSILPNQVVEPYKRVKAAYGEELAAK